MAKPDNSSDDGGLYKALTHPVRTRILLTLEADGTCSPKRFSAASRRSGNAIDLNVASYHFSVLLKYKAIEEIDTVQRRGAVEHIYRINPYSHVPDLMRATELFRRVGAASEGITSGGRIAAEERGVEIHMVEVDELGRQELLQMLESLKVAIAELGSSCRQRLSSSAEQATVMRVAVAADSALGQHDSSD